MRGASPDGAHPGLHSKPLDAASGECLRRIAPAAAMVDELVERRVKSLEFLELSSSCWCVRGALTEVD
jgi:hypothetical protein